MTISLWGCEFHHRLTIAGINLSMLGLDFLAGNYLASNARDGNLIDIHKGCSFINVKVDKRAKNPGITSQQPILPGVGLQPRIAHTLL